MNDMTASPDRAGLLREDLKAIAAAAHEHYDRTLGPAPREWIDAALAATGDSEGLREALENLRDRCTEGGLFGLVPDVLHCLSLVEVAATGGSEGPGLDVERLAEAIWQVTARDVSLWGTEREWAERIAAEYARLSSGDAPVPEGEREGEPKP